MNITMTGRHLEVTPALRDFATEKLNKLSKHFEHLMDVHLILSVEKLTHIAEANIHKAHAPTLHAKATANDMYAAIDALVAKLDAQLHREKEKKIDERSHHNHDHRDSEDTEA